MQGGTPRIIRANSGCPFRPLTKYSRAHEGGLTISATSFARRLLVMSAWERTHIPCHSSLIAREVMLLALSRYDGVNAARVKEFHLTLPYSEDRISQLLKQLTKDGWVTVKKNQQDGRTKFVLPTERLTLLFEEYRRSLQEVLFTTDEV